MKYILTFLQSLVLLGSAIAGEQGRLIVTFAPSDNDRVQVFGIARPDVKNLPIWASGSKEPPLSVGEAVVVSRNRLNNSNGGGDELQLDDIHLAKKSSAGVNEVWFYHLLFSTSPKKISDPVRTQHIVVLMDGRILSSEIMSEKEFEILFMHR